MRTPLCDLLGIELPIVLAPFGPWAGVELAAAVGEAGGIGSLGSAARSPDELRELWARLRRLTGRPFIINHTGRPFNEAAFAATLEAKPKAISFHMGVPAELIARAHEAGVLWLQTVSDVASAEAALKAGADVLIAQGGEAGGHAGWVSTLVLVPAVVNLAGATPVVAAGGIADGRGIAAALALGAQGACLGTRFLATDEMAISPGWKARLVAADALDAVKVAHSERVMPPYNVPLDGATFAPRSLRTPLVDQLEAAPDTVDGAQIGPAFVAAVRAGGGDDYFTFAGQSVALVHDIVPASVLVDRLVREAEAALRAAGAVTGKS